MKYTSRNVPVVSDVHLQAVRNCIQQRIYSSKNQNNITAHERPFATRVYYRTDAVRRTEIANTGKVFSFVCTCARVALLSLNKPPFKRGTIGSIFLMRETKGV